MTTARLRYLQAILQKRYGLLGKAASKYAGAGLHVRVNHPTRHGPAHVLAVGRGQKLAVEVYSGSAPAGTSLVELVARKAELLKAKPVLLLYGDASLSPEALELAKKLGVKVRRMRA
ncbi:MAG: hypothetical protein QXT50_01815 [Thermofilum sp.]